MMPSECPRITPVVQTGRHMEVTFEADGRVWVRAYLAGGRVPMVEPLLADGKGLTVDQAQILSISLQLAIDWAVAEVAKIVPANEKQDEAIPLKETAAG